MKLGRPNLECCLSYSGKMEKTKNNLSQDGRSPKQDFKLAAFKVRIIILRIKTRPKRATLN